MNEIITNLVNAFSEKDLFVILRNISSDADASEYLIKIFASAYAFSWIPDDGIEDILKRLEDDDTIPSVEDVLL